jgi:oxygen-dependent protoporphyrinogen oxidase
LRVVVVGGGISGLTAAFVAAGEGHDVICLDPADGPGGLPGGLIRSERRDGFLCETGPQAVLDDAPETQRLIQALGLESRVIGASPLAQRRFIFVHDRLWPIPMSPSALLGSGLLSWKGKMRLLAEPFIGRPTHARDPEAWDDETVLEFGDRRLGSEASRVLLSTAVIGIYAGEAAGLSVASAFPRIAALEREHGSLLRGMMARAKANRRAGRPAPRPLSFPDGLGELPRALASSLGARLVRGHADAVHPGTTHRWKVVMRSAGVPGAPDTVRRPGAADPARTLDADAVILAAGPGATAAMLHPLVSPGASADRLALEVLTETRRAPVAIACFGFRDATAESLGMDLGAYGFLVARGEGPRLLGCQYESSIFEGRAPKGGVLLRAILGGLGLGFAPEIVGASDADLAASALADLARIAGLRRQDPDLVAVWRHAEGIPQYGPGHATRVAALDRWLGASPRAGLRVIGHAVRGVGVNESIRAAAETARTLESRTT